MPAEQIGLLAAKKDAVVSRLKELGFVYITVDLEGFRSGSMDIYVNRDESAL